ncbi:hypothetical protein [Cytobacillus sp. IB215316]|uniref:hypothetical protein n=1 Tax=Cytobacillus sp. IB215316 TaxID=3097354 RepID=UPI002A0B5F5C|nr:hypothetical protein [Cytobacillus sp. IB215316]MDX8361204.1 hypothetical protein [Cytobacillus sp. IB215316]
MNVANLTEEEYQYVGTGDLVNPTINDFRKLTFHFEIDSKHNVIDLNIDTPEYGEWKNAINAIDEQRYWYGKGSSQTNATYKYDFVFYAKGLTENDITKAFDEMIISASWKKDHGVEQIREFFISNLIVFDGES